MSEQPSGHEVGMYSKVGDAERFRSMGRLQRVGSELVALVAGVAGHPDRANQLDANRHAAFIEDLATQSGYKVLHAPQPTAHTQEQQK